MGRIHCIILDAEQLLLAKATLLDSGEGEASFALLPGFAEGIAGAGPVFVRIFEAAGELETYRGTITGLEGNTLRVGNFTPETYVERRDDVKVIVNKPVYILCPGEKEGSIRKSTATLRDISAGGTCLITCEELPVVGHFEMVFDLDNEADVMQLSVIRREKLEAGGYSYGCHFEDLHPSQESKIREYVFKKHLGLMGRNRN